VPELPEVEITRIAITPYIVGNVVAAVEVRGDRLRWPIPTELAELVPGQIIQWVERRGKYLLLHCPAGAVLIHLGMTGHLRILHDGSDPGKHDHFDLVFGNGIVLRLNDSRRFGAVLWAGPDPFGHKLLSELGPEPLSDNFDGPYLYRRSRMRKLTVKQFIMNHKVVAGIGNIYANEALFHAGILPATPAGQLSESHCEQLAQSIKNVLTVAVNIGLAMLDNSDGMQKLGYFPQQWAVYNRAGLPCPKCEAPIQHRRSGQRSTYYCAACQR